MFMMAEYRFNCIYVFFFFFFRKEQGEVFIFVTNKVKQPKVKQPVS